MMQQTHKMLWALETKLLCWIISTIMLVAFAYDWARCFMFALYGMQMCWSGCDNCWPALGFCLAPSALLFIYLQRGSADWKQSKQQFTICWKGFCFSCWKGNCAKFNNLDSIYCSHPSIHPSLWETTRICSVSHFSHFSTLRCFHSLLTPTTSTCCHAPPSPSGGQLAMPDVSVCVLWRRWRWGCWWGGGQSGPANHILHISSPLGLWVNVKPAYSCSSLHSAVLPFRPFSFSFVREFHPRRTQTLFFFPNDVCLLPLFGFSVCPGWWTSSRDAAPTCICPPSLPVSLTYFPTCLCFPLHLISSIWNMYRACSFGTANEEKCVRWATSSERIDRRDDLEPVQSSRNEGKDANKHPMNPDEGLSVY